MIPLSLRHKRTDEMTDEELDGLYKRYVDSKTVRGRFCPTPDLSPPDGDEDVEDLCEAPVVPSNIPPRTCSFCIPFAL